MPKDYKAKLLIVEDDPPLLKGLLDFFVFNGFEAVGVEDGLRCLKIALNDRFDLMLLDVMLPGLDGFSICRQVRDAKPQQPIIMLTAKGSEEDVVTGFKAGADDYVSKPFSLRELMVRVEAVLRRSGRMVSEDEINLADILFDPKTLTARRGDTQMELTRREMDLIQYFYRSRDRIVSKRELLENVWQYTDSDVETRTVDIHILKLRKKLDTLSEGREFIVTIRGEGWRLSPEV
jgi:DNA-binding response OmpR family regulator